MYQMMKEVMITIKIKYGSGILQNIHELWILKKFQEMNYELKVLNISL